MHFPFVYFSVRTFFRWYIFSSVHFFVRIFFLLCIFSSTQIFVHAEFRLCHFSSTQNFVCAIFRPRSFRPRRFSPLHFSSLRFFVHAFFSSYICFRPRSSSMTYVHERIRVEVCAPSSERCRLYAVGRASRSSAAPIPPPMTTWWWVGHRRPAPKRRSGSRLVSPGARHARGGGRPPHRRPRGGGVHPGGFFIQEQYLHRIRRRPTELCLQSSDTDCAAGRCPWFAERRRTPLPTCCWSVPPCTDLASVCWETAWQRREQGRRHVFLPVGSKF